MHLARDCRNRDLEDFFAEHAGKVRAARLITDRNSRRSKGIAYVEFYDRESKLKAHQCAGMKLLGRPIIIQESQSEKNRMAEEKLKQITRIALSNIAPQTTEEKLQILFSSFQNMKSVHLDRDPSGQSLGTGYVEYSNPETAQLAIDTMNGYEVDGYKLTVSLTFMNSSGKSLPAAPAGVAQALEMVGNVPLTLPVAAAPKPSTARLPIPDGMPSRFLLLKNLFDPSKETDPHWDADIRDEVLEEAITHGPVVHIFVDKNSQGYVYLKFQDSPDAVTACRAMHGRLFAGLMVTADYLTAKEYHEKFPEAENATEHLKPTS
eukprot:m.97809 g.97809  ORF g.97809 m.97809 type:complete len:320 (+) comp22066_c1_seq3:1603-2562(+)